MAVLLTVLGSLLVPHAPAQAEESLGGPGYALSVTAGLRPTGYTVYLITSYGVSDFRPALAEVETQLDGLGIPITVAPGTIAEREPAVGEITVKVADACPEGKAGCASRAYAWGSAGGGPDPDKNYVTGGKFVLEPVALNYNAASKRHLVAHEMAHVLNLDHYNETYNGQTQVMHETTYTDGQYRSGDINGLVYGRNYGAYTPPPPPPVDRRRIGIVDLNGNCIVNEGGVSTPGELVRGPGCTQIALDGERIAVRESSGHCFVKEGGLGAPWSLLRAPNCVKVALDGNRIVALDSDGSCHAKEGPTDALWVTIWATTCVDITLDNYRIAVRDTTNRCHVKEGNLGDLWAMVRGPGCLHIAVDGSRIVTADADTSCSAKEGPLGAPWVLQRAVGCVGIALDGTRIVAREAGNCYAKDGSLTAQWAMVYGTFCERASLDGDRIAVRDSRFEDCYVKEGWFDSPWTYKWRCKDIVVSDGVT